MNKILIISLVFCFSAISTYAQKADRIIGKYHLPNNIEVEIFKSNGKYFGKIIKLNNFEDGQLLDFKNPDDAKQKEELLGKIIIHNLEYDAETNQWVNGTMYGAEKGMVFDLKITSYSKNEIEVVGSKYLFWKTLIWKAI